MTTSGHVVKATSQELRAGWWWPLVGLACCAGSALIVLAPLVLWFLDQSTQRQGEIIQTIAAAVAVLAVAGIFIETTARLERQGRL